jgi:hypothetical protein
VGLISAGRRPRASADALLSPPPDGAARTMAVSTSDSHSLHCGQRPCHFGLAKPQFWQTYCTVDFGILPQSLSCRVQRRSSPGAIFQLPQENQTFKIVQIGGAIAPHGIAHLPQCRLIGRAKHPAEVGDVLRPAGGKFQQDEIGQGNYRRAIWRDLAALPLPPPTAPGLAMQQAAHRQQCATSCRQRPRLLPACSRVAKVRDRARAPRWQSRTNRDPASRGTTCRGASRHHRQLRTAYVVERDRVSPASLSTAAFARSYDCCRCLTARGAAPG